MRVQTLEARRVLTAIVMTPHEQLLLELINRARADPGAEAARYGIGLNEGINPTIVDTPKQPVAPNQFLLNAARAHSQDMLDNNYFQHISLTGTTPSDRAIAAGYPVGVWENISYGGSTGPIDPEANVYERHRRLFISVTGHRENILLASHQEVGPGVRFGEFTSGQWTYNVGMVTEKFGNPPGNSFLTGVVFTDASDGSADDNDFYEIGEQIGSGTITATNLATGDAFSTTIGPSGGYSLQLAPGTYDVTATGGALPAAYRFEGITIGSQNIKVDFETTTAPVFSGNDPVTPALSLSIAASAIAENGSGTTGTVSRTGDTSNSLVVNLTSGDITEASVPATVVIAAGATTANFSITPVDDDSIDGNQTVTVSVAASGLTGDAQTIEVTDDDQPQPPFSRQYDFGTGSSPLQSNYTRVSGATTYNASRGYGWTTTVNHLDRRAGNDLARDLHYRNEATFLVDVPNGTYEVVLTMGDTGPSAHDQTISLEGSVVGNVATAPRQIVTRTYTTTVTDGQLTVYLDGRGGVDQNMVLSGLQLTATGDPPPPTPQLSLALADSAIAENGGTTTATVSRGGDTTSPVVVSVASSDTGEATVPSSVTIAAGQTSADFAVSGVDESIVDGTQTVTLTVSANGHDGDNQSLSVTDDDVAPPDPPADPIPTQFDFGTTNSPLETNHTRVTGSTTYDATRGYGWTTTVIHLDRRAGNDLARDLHYRSEATFLVDVANGTYEVTLTVGDTGPSAHDQAISLEGVVVDNVGTAPRQILTRTYTTTVNDGQLTVYLDGRGGVDQNMVISGLQVIATGDPPPPTPQLSLALASTSISENGGSTAATVSRSGDTTNPIVVSIVSNDTGEATVPSTVTIAAGQTSANFTVTGVDESIVDGTQTLAIAVSANGHDGDNQSLSVTDDDVAPPDPPADPVPQQFDFGTTTSPLETDHSRVTGSTTYNATRGYGWTTTVNHLDRRAGNDLARDLHYRNEATFLVDVANGTYEVTLTVGDTGPSAHDQTISLEGVVVGNVSTAPRQILTRTYTTTVNDGQLTVYLDGRGGVDQNMVISGLQLAAVGDPPPPTPALSLSLSQTSISENGGITTGTVTRNGSTSDPLVVSVSSSDTSEATVASTVTIPAGQASATFSISAVDDSLVDGTQTTTIGVSATGFESDNSNLSVTDDDAAVDPVSLQFDFGTPTSPLEEGHTRVIGSTTYNETRGYGWTTTVNHLDRRSGTDLTRDLHYRNVATFLVDIPNGAYEVTLTMGDGGPSAHDQTVSIEGATVDSVRTSARQFVTRTYAAVVNDGQLTIVLDGRGGVDQNMVLSGMQIEEVSSQQAATNSFRPDDVDEYYSNLPDGEVSLF